MNFLYIMGTSVYNKLKYPEEKNSNILSLSITLFCTVKLMQKCTINLTIIINATIGIK